MAAASALELAAWRLRSEDFREVRAFDDGRPIVVMEFDPADRGHLADWLWLRQRWLDLPPLPQVLDAITSGTGTKLLLRYAAIDWRHAPVAVDDGAMGCQLVATWGAQLTEALRRIVNELPETDAAQFLRPFVKVDLANDLRIGFLPVVRSDPDLPLEVRTSWPCCDERSAVYVIGQTIRSLCVGLGSRPATELRKIVDHCCEGKISNRYRTLEELQLAWSALAFPSSSGHRLAAWQQAEAGIGWLELRNPRAALSAFRSALELNPALIVAKEGRDRALAALGEADEPPREPRPPRRTRSWEEIAEQGRRLEADHAIAEALVLYGSARLRGPHEAVIHLSIARCHLALRDAVAAVEHAKRAVSLAPQDVAARSALARANLLAHRDEDALRAANDWLAIAPEDAAAHHARGRSLLALGRPLEARDAFDRACALQPRMLEAMLLRREADRALRRVGKQVGTAVAMTIDIPDHLAALREPLAAGRVQDAIAMLERPEYGHDAVATLVHAECLAFEQRHEEAIAQYERAAALAPEQRQKAVVGKVHALLSLDRAAEALAELDAARDLVDVELVELRGLALQRLGLPDDAESELGRVVAASGSRSDRRLGRR